MMHDTTRNDFIAVNPDTQDSQDILHVASSTEHLRIGVLS